ncbi:hypothetical protein IFM89_006159 [Coptis chinensis]|uniref:NTF2-like domain-containing protein n=1 Tax=Coptis chinensis TaxID=261450 RepID=A0A835LB50_9MAGN|nr:hypothetical protein IFM89_006159 [Coptis chinensis]
MILGSLPKLTVTTQFTSVFKYENYVRVTLSSGLKVMSHFVHGSSDFHSPNKKKPLVQRSFSSRNGVSLLVPHGIKSSGYWEEDSKVLEAVLKLYSAIKQRNLRDVSDVIGDECRCVCNFISYFHPFHGKQQVLEFFSYLMRYMGQNLEFVVQPTLHDGMHVTVKWRLEWKKTRVPLGTGFSFYVCHTYQGKVVIKNMEMFMEPLLHIEPLRLKIMGLVMTVLEAIGSCDVEGKRIRMILLSMVIVVASVFLTTLFMS